MLPGVRGGGVRGAGGAAGVVGMCKEHLGVALALKVPVFFMVTKVAAPPPPLKPACFQPELEGVQDSRGGRCQAGNGPAVLVARPLPRRCGCRWTYARSTC